MRAMILLTALLMPGAALADCRGVATSYRCTEADGTRSRVQMYGPQVAEAEGENPASGDRWSQRSFSAGKMTATRGRSAGGERWRWNSQTIGGRTYTHGVDPQGRAFTQVCDRFRCY